MRTIRRFSSVFLVLAGLAAPASAQIQLPGAPSPTPAVPFPEAQAPKPKPKPAPPKVLSEDALLGRDFQRNGSRGRLSLAKAGAGAYTARIVAVGEKISKPTEACGVDLGNGQPLAMKSLGRPDGVPRFALDVPGCALTLDMADQSVLIEGDEACTFSEVDCRVDPRGLWGPPPQDLEPKAGVLEGERSRAEKSARETFKLLMARTKDKAQLKALVSEQAGFAAARETLCRDYAREPAHGFCGARYTELRAASLEARRARMEAGGQLKPKPKPKPKPVAATPPAPADPLR